MIEPLHTSVSVTAAVLSLKYRFKWKDLIACMKKVSRKTNNVLTGKGTERLSSNISVLCLWRVELAVIVLGALLTYAAFDFYLYTQLINFACPTCTLIES